MTIIYGAVITAQSHCHCMSSPAVHLMSADSALNPQTKPNNLGCESASRPLPSTSTIAILLLLRPKADTHFTVRRRVEG